METVSVSREFDAVANEIRSVFDDVTSLFETAGFVVERDGTRLELTKRGAVTQVDLAVRLRDDESDPLAYEQVSGPFETIASLLEIDEGATRRPNNHHTVSTGGN